MKTMISAFLLAAGQICSVADAAAQDSADELQRLERRAEESFAADELDQTVTLYRQLADRVASKPEKLRVLLLIASVEHLAGHDIDALETLTKALVLERDYPFRPELYDEQFRGLFHEAQKRAVARRAQSAARHTREGTDHLRRNDHDAARRSFEQALAADPERANAIYNLALVNLRDGREEEAQAGFERLLALAANPSPTIPRVLKVRSLTNLGYLYSRRQQYQEAEEALRQAAEIDQDDPLIWLNLGDARRRLGKKSLAAEAFRRAFELAPDDADAIGNLALAYIDAEDWGRAVALLLDATARRPSRSDLWLFLGRAQAGLGNGQGAVAALEKAIRLDPGNAAGHAEGAAIHLAIHYYGIGDYQRTRQQADRALGWRPDLVNGWVYRGLALTALGKLGDARESLETARRLDPTQAATHSNLGIVYYKLGQLDAAAASFERALEIDPGFDDARRNLEAVARAGAR